MTFHNKTFYTPTEDYGHSKNNQRNFSVPHNYGEDETNKTEMYKYNEISNNLTLPVSKELFENFRNTETNNVTIPNTVIEDYNVDLNKNREPGFDKTESNIESSTEHFSKKQQTDGNYELTTNEVNSKNYQSLLDRFRRKNLTDNERVNTNLETKITEETTPNIRELKSYHTSDLDPLEIRKKTVAIRNENSSMEKLIDDATRTKILYDYFKTINKNVEPTEVASEIEDDMNFNETTNINNSSESEFREFLEAMNGTFLNESLVPADSFPSSQVSTITKIMRTPRPDFVDGKLI